jgi:hypothetical protein
MLALRNDEIVFDVLHHVSDEFTYALVHMSFLKQVNDVLRSTPEYVHRLLHVMATTLATQVDIEYPVIYPKLRVARKTREVESESTKRPLIRLSVWRTEPVTTRLRSFTFEDSTGICWRWCQKT